MSSIPASSDSHPRRRVDALDSHAIFRALRPLADVEMQRYRADTANPERRRTTLTWARELPIDGEPADVDAEVQAYGEFMARSPVPKLFINAEPGALLTGRAREFCRSWPCQTEVTVPGIHCVQEDAPHEIGAALRRFVQQLPAPMRAAMVSSEGRPA